MKCEFCGEQRETTGAILSGKFGQACRECRSGASRQASPLFAEYSRERDREDNRRDMLQPRNHKGQPNLEFYREYKDNAKQWFSKDEIKKLKEQI